MRCFEEDEESCLPKRDEVLVGIENMIGGFKLVCACVCVFIYISFKLSFCCLEVVCAGIYFDLKNKGYSLSACLSTKGVLSYLKPYKP